MLVATAARASVYEWILTSGRRRSALTALSSGEVMTAAEVARLSGRTVQNISQALRELRSRGLVAIIGPNRRSWRCPSIQWNKSPPLCHRAEWLRRRNPAMSQLR